MDEMVLMTQQWLNGTYGNNPQYVSVLEDGATGQSTFRALIRALQIELGVSADGSFGNSTLNAMPATISQVANPDGAASSNLHFIIQGSCWCKGYNPGGFTGVFGSGTASAVREFQTDAGITVDGIIRPYIMQGLMNTDGYVLLPGQDPDYRTVQRKLNEIYGARIGLTASNGLWDRKAQTNLIKACQTEWGVTADGSFGNGTMNVAPTLSRNTSGYTNSKRLLQMALTVNGYYPGGLTGTFGNGTYNAVYNFQDFLCLGADGIAGKNTWASLLKSNGNSQRAATACDTATRLTQTTANSLVAAGYNTVGRYLTNTDGGVLDKKMTRSEIQIMANAGLKVFPIYQTTGFHIGYFTSLQGSASGFDANSAAYSLGFPTGAVIFFAVDYDVRTTEIPTIVAYFRAVKDSIGSFRVGVYGPRAICNELAAQGITVASFVSDMSSGFEGNIGHKMPSDWAYDQIAEIQAGGIGIDKCITSSRATAISASALLQGAAQQDLSIYETIYNGVAYYYGDPAVPVHLNNVGCMGFLSNFPYSGFNWDLFGGSVDSGLVNHMNNTLGIWLTPGENHQHVVTLQEPSTGETADFKHLFYSMRALYYTSLIYDFEANDITGWAGDLLSMGQCMAESKNENADGDYWNVNNLTKFVGATDIDMAGWEFWYKGAESEHTTFPWGDLAADVDAYNMCHEYNLESDTLYEILEDYYNNSCKWRTRFRRFKDHLTNTHQTDLYTIAYNYTSNTAPLVSEFFGIYEGIPYDVDLYAGPLAQAFTNKIDILISRE